MVATTEAVRRRLQAVPDSPGVYLFRDAAGQVIYVGKAVRLRDRLRSYFTPGYAQSPRLADLLRKVNDFEFVKTENEVEALVLECNLIKHYRPRYNIRLKDDKNYLYLKLPITEEFPTSVPTPAPRACGARCGACVSSSPSGPARTRSSVSIGSASTTTSIAVLAPAKA
jgi:excinuclease ABC subunit C